MFIIVVSILVAVGFAALLHAAKRDSVGYEDDSGFHFGEEQKQHAIAPVAPAAPLAIMPIEERTIYLNPLPAKEESVKRKNRKKARKNRTSQVPALHLELDSGLPNLIGPGAISAKKS